MSHIHESVLKTNGNFDRHFARTIAIAVSRIPFRIGELLESSKSSIMLTPTVVDLYPHLANVRPRGWPKGWSWKQSDGVFSKKDRMVVIAQGMFDHNGALEENKEDWLGIMFHELGHGVDLALGNFSKSPEFIQAYLMDLVKLLGTPDEKELTYFLQGFEIKKNCTTAGLDETFAESFAILCGQASRQDHAAVFCRRFPFSIQAVKKKLERI